MMDQYFGSHSLEPFESIFIGSTGLAGLANAGGTSTFSFHGQKDSIEVSIGGL